MPRPSVTGSAIYTDDTYYLFIHIYIDREFNI